MMMLFSSSILSYVSVLHALCWIGSCRASNSEENAPTYGVDTSYPMHHSALNSNYPWLPHNVDPDKNPTPPEFTNVPINPLGDEPAHRYEKYIQGCIQNYSSRSSSKADRCVEGEEARIAMTLRQPQGVYNYTATGFTKIRAPAKVFSLLQSFWEQNRGNETKEKWSPGNVYTNHWDHPTYMLSVGEHKNGGSILKQHIWDAARDTLQHWTGHRLAECSLYGIRIYKRGAMLAPHVDRLPLVSSAIINVDQDVDEPWPLEVIGHDGVAHNVTMLPGDMVLYESHSIIHGRQFPLQGNFMANVFIHFEPIGPLGGAVQTTRGGLPPYIVPESAVEHEWRRENPNGHIVMGEFGKFATGSTELHHSAQLGDIDTVQRLLLDGDEELLLNARDANGWSALHEAVRTGATEIVQLLIAKGAQVNARTGKKQNGDSVLALAKRFHGDDHAVVQHLVELGAQEVRYGMEL